MTPAWAAALAPALTGMVQTTARVVQSMSRNLLTTLVTCSLVTFFRVLGCELFTIAVSGKRVHWDYDTFTFAVYGGLTKQIHVSIPRWQDLSNVGRGEESNLSNLKR